MIFSNYFSSLFRTGPLHQRRVLYYHILGYCVNRFFEKVLGSGFGVQGSGFRVQGSGLWWQLRCHIYGAMPEGKWIAGFPFGISKH